MSEKSKPGAGGLLIVERATTGSGEFIGLRLTLPESDKITLVFADQKAMPGFRYGKEFIPDFGETVRYADELSQLREDLAQRDAEVKQWEARCVAAWERGDKDGTRLTEQALEIVQLQARLAALESQQAASVGGERDREADRAVFTDPLFNKWLDEPITENGEYSVWHQVGDTGAAWHGWENRQFYVDQEYAELRARAALSPAGGGVVTKPTRDQCLDGFVNAVLVWWHRRVDASNCNTDSLLNAIKEQVGSVPEWAKDHWALNEQPGGYGRGIGVSCGDIAELVYMAMSARLNAKPQANSQEGE